MAIPQGYRRLEGSECRPVAAARRSGAEDPARALAVTIRVTAAAAEPGRDRVAFSWHAGTPEAEATSVEVTFTPGGPGSTVVRLVHSGWERRPDGAAAREGYDSGWDPVISAFAGAARLPAVVALIRGH